MQNLPKPWPRVMRAALQPTEGGCLDRPIFHPPRCPAEPAGELHDDELDIRVRGARQRNEVTRIGGEDVVAVGGQQHDRGVNDVT